MTYVYSCMNKNNNPLRRLYFNLRLVGTYCFDDLSGWRIIVYKLWFTRKEDNIPLLGFVNKNTLRHITNRLMTTYCLSYWISLFENKSRSHSPGSDRNWPTDPPRYDPTESTDTEPLPSRVEPSRVDRSRGRVPSRSPLYRVKTESDGTIPVKTR